MDYSWTNTESNCSIIKTVKDWKQINKSNQINYQICLSKHNWKIDHGILKINTENVNASLANHLELPGHI